MRTIFHGWRRKLGCVTLAVALMLTGLWFRAQVQSDAAYFNEARVNVLSERAWLILVWFPSGNRDGTAVNWRSWTEQRTDPFEDQEPAWRWELAGIQVGTYGDDEPATLVVIPHMWLIVPLTLASAYLILWKPRQKESEPPPTADPSGE